MIKKMLISICGVLFSSAMAFAGEASTSGISAGDTAWILASSALVFLMTPGLALFYGGMVRSKNVLGTLMHSFIAIAVISVQWVLLGYSLSFGPDINGFIGGLDWFGLKGVGLEPNPDYAPSIPHLTFMIYQCMFAIITPALISGAFAERKKFSAYILFILLWSTLVYDPVAHWVWGTGGWLKRAGVLDFAGGIVVHLTSGVSALVAALIVGKRKGYTKEPMVPHNLPMTVLGAGLLWFGWFGFNAGSALTSGGLSTMAFVTTHTAASASTVVWVIIEWVHRGKATMFGAATGSIAGLATITPAAGFVSPISALAIGAAAGLLCYTALNMKGRFGYDDSLDVFGVHGISGMTGTLGAGLLASLAVNQAGSNGLFFGNPGTFLIQAKAIATVAVYSIVATFIILKLIDLTVGLRIKDEHEVIGLDLSQHGERGYTMTVDGEI
ncbi:MAG: ammonium transporter [Nitrospirae bacterium]|nr:ammonium transporter [Nitrospirota bacterium]